ncbi:uncharacterized protein LOC131600343 [Vicia villosa]|uniref:uncharacterized protein LOC131600343 n=1 Tax=Vicia villosa TaxID=3911 RepID=UPI00273AD3F6|nr:uncharacterized protein LOC131600343 [Vicia villosa]
MLDPRRYHYQPTISFPVISDDISLQQKPHTNNNICQTKNINNDPHDQSGMCSPPLWTTKSKSTNYRSLSPESKIEAIERGQRELMEMVKNMPESSYELTLKDLVEEQQQQQQQQHRHHHVEEHNNNNRVVKQKSLNNKKANRREGMMDKRSISTGHGNNIDSGGFYLKMVFPISLGSSKKQYYKKNKESSLVNSNNSNNNSKVSPRTSSVSDHGSVSKDWWKKKKSGSECGGESDHSASTKRSGSISTNSSCSSRSNTSRHEISASSCWPFTRRSEILTQK